MRGPAPWAPSARSPTRPGTLPAGSFLSAHTGASESADLTFGRFMSVLEQDMDDLYAVAFDMTTTDESTAATYGAGTPGTSRPGGPR